MYFRRACIAEHLNDVGHRRTADDRVIDQNDSFPSDCFRDRIELDMYRLLALALLRLDKSSSDIVIFNVM